MCYTISADRRGCDHLPLKLLLKVGTLSPMVSFPIGPSRRVCLLIFTSFLWCRVGGAPDYSKGFHGDFLSDDGEETCDCVERTHTRWQSGWTLDSSDRRATDIVEWCNGSTEAFETLSVGSNPSSTATCSISFFFLLPPRVRAEVLTYYYLLQMACSPVQVGRGEHSIFGP